MHRRMRMFPGQQAVHAWERSKMLRAQGVLDDVVDISSARALHAAAKRPVAPLWVENADHQNLELSAQYLPRLRAFLQEVRAKGRQ